MAFKFFMSALALTGSVLAQCGDGTDFTIVSPGDVSKFTGCTTWNGNILIDSNISGVVQIDYIRTLDGDLVCKNAPNLNTISAPELQEIKGTLDLETIEALSTLQMDALTTVKAITFIGLPNLYALQFTRGVTEAQDVYISNTKLRDLKGIELMTVSRMDVNNNNELNTINVNNMTNVTTSLSFSANGPNLNVMLPNLLSATNLTFRACSSVEIPSLSEVLGAVGFYGNTFQNVSAANLTQTNGTVAIVGCSSLTDISFPQLNLVNGGLIIANNSELKSIEGFPELARVAGAVDLYGTFDSADLPALSIVRGAATIVTSSSNATICDSFKQQGSDKKISGKVTCNPNTADPTQNATSGGSDKKNAASSVSTTLSTALTGAVGLAVALFFL